jgi:hypothetical protein
MSSVLQSKHVTKWMISEGHARILQIARNEGCGLISILARILERDGRLVVSMELSPTYKWSFLVPCPTSMETSTSKGFLNGSLYALCFSLYLFVYDLDLSLDLGLTQDDRISRSRSFAIHVSTKDLKCIDFHKFISFLQKKTLRSIKGMTTYKE